VRPIVNGGNSSTNGTLASGLSNFLTRSNGNRPNGNGNGGGGANTSTSTSKNATVDSATAGNSFAINGLVPTTPAATITPTPTPTPPGTTADTQPSGGSTSIESNLATGTEEALKRTAAALEQSTLSSEATNAVSNSTAGTSRNTPAAAGTSGRAGKFTSPRAAAPPLAVSRGPSRVIKQSTAQAELANPGENGSPIPTIFTLRSPYIDAIKNVFPDSSKANAALRRASSPAESQTATASEK
jgi:hypothetical protein